jgi:hypothetical protein
MRRVAIRLVFEALDRRDHPGSWGIFNILDPISTLLDHSHGKAKAKASVHRAPAIAGGHRVEAHLQAASAHEAVVSAEHPHHPAVKPHQAASKAAPATTPRA